jgi:16S rRNA pseudouridine516 synthase
VVHLRRTRIGGLSLDPALAPGSFRPLTDQELALLQQKEG